MKKIKSQIEMRYYDILSDEYLLALYGDSWKRKYEYVLHIHNLLEVGICLEGEGNLWLGEECFDYCAGMITIIPAHSIHALESKKGSLSHWEYLFLDADKLFAHFYPDELLLRERLMGLVNKKAFSIEKEDYPLILSLLEVIFGEIKSKKVLYKECLLDLSHALLIQILRIHTDSSFLPFYAKEESQMKLALNFIHQHYALPIKVCEIANACHLSESHFRRIFAENISMTPMEYLNTYRITKASELIKKKKGNIEEIAQQVGFTTMSTFNRNFKQIFDVSPSQWRKNPNHYERKLEKFNVLIKKGW